MYIRSVAAAANNQFYKGQTAVQFAHKQGRYVSNSNQAPNLYAIMEIENLNQAIAIIVIVFFGGYALHKVFKHMKDGFGIFNVRITGLVVVATLASILAVLDPSTQAAAIGILGAIAGYLFGFGSKD